MVLRLEAWFAVAIGALQALSLFSQARICYPIQPVGAGLGCSRTAHCQSNNNDEGAVKSS